MERVILKQDVGYCELEGHLYFLDVSRDRYLGASASLAATVDQLLQGGELSESSRKQLIDTGLFVEAEGRQKVLEPPCQLHSAHAITGRSAKIFPVYTAIYRLPCAVLFLAIFHGLVGRLHLGFKLNQPIENLLAH